MEIGGEKTQKMKAVQTCGIVVALLCAFLAGYLVAPVEQRGWRANVFVGYELFGGSTELSTHNVVTDIGEAQIRTRGSTGATYVAFSYISIGNATAGQTLTQLTTQYARELGAVVDWTNAGDSAFNVTYMWTFSETVNLNCAGNHWASSGDGNMGAVAGFPSGAQTFNSGENLTVRWVWTVNAND
jgi:hypothetical protein